MVCCGTNGSQPLIALHGRPVVTDAIRDVLAAARSEISAGEAAITDEALLRSHREAGGDPDVHRHSGACSI